jgi:hypothetical protein
MGLAGHATALIASPRSSSVAESEPGDAGLKVTSRPSKSTATHSVPEGHATPDNGAPLDWSSGEAGDHEKLARAASGKASATSDRIIATSRRKRHAFLDAIASVRTSSKQPATQLMPTPPNCVFMPSVAPNARAPSYGGAIITVVVVPLSNLIFAVHL